MGILRVIAALLLTATTGCHGRPDPAPRGQNHTSDYYVKLAMEADAELLAQPPSMAAAERHALRLAELSRAANAAPRGHQPPAGATRLAIVADSVRDELLACRRPMWELRLPEPTESLALATWLESHEAELKRGLDAGWVAYRGDVESTLSAIDARLSDSEGRDGDLYRAPPLRRHRGYLADHILPRAREMPGVATLPTGHACFEAIGRSKAGALWAPREAEQLALRTLRTTSLGPPTVDVGVITSAEPAAWGANLALERGIDVYQIATRDPARAPTLLRALALGTLIDLELHRDGGSEASAFELARRYPVLSPRQAEALIEVSRDRPLLFVATMLGHQFLVSLERSLDIGAGLLLQRASGLTGLPPGEFEERLRD